MPSQRRWYDDLAGPRLSRRQRLLDRRAHAHAEGPDRPHPARTSLPSALIGVVYGAGFYSMGMAFSAAGSLLTGVLWGGIAALWSPPVASALPERLSALIATGQFTRNR